ncbi:MAG TPA: hypothetical protein VII81_13280 [Terriglobales bacterium]
MSAESELDIRWPIGLLFSLMGAMVAIYGLISSDRTFYRPLDMADTRMINLNLSWGLVMLAFGALMILGAVRAGRKAARD